MSEFRVESNTEATSASAVDLELLAELDGNQFPHITEHVRPVLGVTCSAIVLVEDTTLWFCSRFGFSEGTTPREGALWDAVMATDEPFIVADLLADPRFADGPPLIGGVPVRFFASIVLRAQDGRRIGIYCGADPEPGVIDDMKVQALSAVGPHIEATLVGVQELDRAAEVQRALLPKSVPPLVGYEVAGTCVPSKAVGGDFFDWYAIEGGMAFTLADVMGKGVGAGIVAATVRATIRSTTREPDVALAVEQSAEILAQDLSEARSFVTLFHGRLRASDGWIRYVDAGHGLSVVVDADGGSRRLSTTDLPLGSGFDAGWRGRELTLEEGSTLVVFSDGVLDLYTGGLDAADRVAEIVRASSSASEIVAEIERLARRDAAPDDVTVVAIRRSLSRSEPAAPRE